MFQARIDYLAFNSIMGSSDIIYNSNEDELPLNIEVNEKTENIVNESDKQSSTQIKSKLSKMKKRKACKQCDKTFLNSTSLNFHVQSVHKGKKPHKCQYCNDCFSHWITLKRHIVSVHEREKLHKCPHCDKKVSV